jgi:hypothetical protein
VALARVTPPDENGKRVVESERRQQRPAGAAVFVADDLEDL